MGIPTVETAQNARLDEALTCLLLWALTLGGEVPEKCAKTLGLNEADMDRLLSENAQDAQNMRKLRLIGELFGRKQLGLLLRARLAQLIFKAEEAREIQALTRAASQLPAWAFGDVPASPGGGGSRSNGGVDLDADWGEDEDIKDMDVEQAIRETRMLLAAIDRMPEILPDPSSTE
jgi:hypothetical protein